MAAVFEVMLGHPPIGANAPQLSTARFNGVVDPSPAFVYGPHVIWGVTGRILTGLRHRRPPSATSAVE